MSLGVTSLPCVFHIFDMQLQFNMLFSILTDDFFFHRIAPDQRHRTRRDTEAPEPAEDKESLRQAGDKTIISTIKREARKFCDNGGGM